MCINGRDNAIKDNIFKGLGSLRCLGGIVNSSNKVENIIHRITSANSTKYSESEHFFMLGPISKCETHCTKYVFDC